MLRSLHTVVIAIACCDSAATGLRITGTFSDIRADQRGVFGAEVRIAVTHDPPYQAIVQFGNGEFCDAADLGDEPCFRVSRLIVVDAVFDWRKDQADGHAHLEFKLPPGNPYGGTFQGNISTDELVGVFQFDSGKRLPVKLRRGPSHWDK